MKVRFHFSRLDVALLITNSMVLGGCIVLLFLSSIGGPLIVLTIGTLALLIGKLGRSYSRLPPSSVSVPPSEDAT